MKGAATLLLRSPHVAEAGLLYSWAGATTWRSTHTAIFPSDPFVHLPEKQVITLHEFVGDRASSSAVASTLNTSFPGMRSTTSAWTCATATACTRAYG